MKAEIKRSGWSRFCRKFNRLNQYRNMTVMLRRKGGKDKTPVLEDCPFIGLSLGKSGRAIDSILVYAGQYDPDALLQPVICFNEPTRITEESDRDGTCVSLVLESTDGSELIVGLAGEGDSGRFYSLVEKVAYSLAERRGFTHGSDKDDWYEAERRIRHLETQLV